MLFYLVYNYLFTQLVYKVLKTRTLVSLSTLSNVHTNATPISTTLSHVSPLPSPPQMLVQAGRQHKEEHLKKDTVSKQGEHNEIDSRPHA